MCTPTLEQLELFPLEQLRLVLVAHNIVYEQDYDRYDLLTLALHALNIDCPRYTPQEIIEIRKGTKIPSGDPNIPNIVRILIPLQRQCVEQMRKIAKRHDVLLNTSDTGTGKTLMGLALGVLENKKIFIVTKTNIVPNWLRVIRDNELTNVLGITSYELGIRAKEYKLNSWTKNNEGKLVWKNVTIPSKYIRRSQTTRSVEEKVGSKKSTDILLWNNIENTLIIFDEPHNSKNSSSFAHQLLITCFEYIKREPDANNTLLLLGNTPADKTVNLGYLYKLLEIEKTINKTQEEKEDPNRMNTAFMRLNKILYNPTNPRAARVSKQALEDSMGGAPPVTVRIEAFKMSSEAEQIIEEQNQLIADLVSDIRAGTSKNKFGQIQSARRIIELQKAPTFANIAIDALNRGRSVIIFVTYYNTSNVLFDLLKDYDPRLFTGKTPKNQRQSILDGFQMGEFNLLIAHQDLAREGVNMHDLKGDHPRTVIITPTISGITAVQILGRADRLCRLSDTEQIIVYAQTNTTGGKAVFGWDSRLMELMRDKIHNIKELNEGDDAMKFMRSLYAEAKQIKVVDYAPKVIKISEQRLAKVLQITKKLTEIEKAQLEIDKEIEEEEQ